MAFILAGENKESEILYMEEEENLIYSDWMDHALKDLQQLS